MLTACEYMLPEGIQLGQHRVGVQQGNTLTEESIRNLRAGMDVRQVRFLLGTPLVSDPFHPERWDYPLYVEATEAGKASRLDVLSLYFEGGRLKEVRRVVRIDPDAEKIEPGAELDTISGWFEPGDALVLEGIDEPGLQDPAVPAPDILEDEAVAEPEQAPQQ